MTTTATTSTSRPSCDGEPLTDLATADPPLRLSVGERSGACAVLSGRACGDVALSPGDAAARSARADVLRGLGLDLADAVFAQQIHGARVAHVGSRDRGRGADHDNGGVPDTDALITTDPGVAVCVQVADCVPVALAVDGLHDDARRGVGSGSGRGVGSGTRRGVGAVHAGRAGVQAGVVGAAVAALADAAGARPGDLAALVGPAIGGCCYEVPAELVMEVGTIVPAARATSQWGTPALDLPAAVRSQLRAAGVDRVATVGSCTRCDHERWYSHRAWTAGRAAPGRQMLAVALAAVDAGDGTVDHGR